MSHPIPQEVEEKIEYGVGKIMGALPTHLSSEDYRDIQIVSRQALLSVYNSGRESARREGFIQGQKIGREGIISHMIVEFNLPFQRITQPTSAPSSEDND